MQDSDYKQVWAEFWEPMFYRDGSMQDDRPTLDAIQRELHDFHVLLEEVPKAYDEVTGGVLSKANTAAHYVAEYAEKNYTRYAKEDLIERLQEALDEGKVPGLLERLRYEIKEYE